MLWVYFNNNWVFKLFVKKFASFEIKISSFSPCVLTSKKGKFFTLFPVGDEVYATIKMKCATMWFTFVSRVDDITTKTSETNTRFTVNAMILNDESECIEISFALYMVHINLYGFLFCLICLCKLFAFMGLCIMCTQFYCKNCEYKMCG